MRGLPFDSRLTSFVRPFAFDTTIPSDMSDEAIRRKGVADIAPLRSSGSRCDESILRRQPNSSGIRSEVLSPASSEAIGRQLPSGRESGSSLVCHSPKSRLSPLTGTSPVIRLARTWRVLPHFGGRQRDNWPNSDAPSRHLPGPAAHEGSTIRQRDLLASLLEVKTIEREYVSPICCRNFSYRRGRSRLAAHLQMGSDCRRLAGSDVAKRGRLSYSSLSRLRRISDKPIQPSKMSTETDPLSTDTRVGLILEVAGTEAKKCGDFQPNQIGVQCCGPGDQGRSSRPSGDQV